MGFSSLSREAHLEIARAGVRARLAKRAERGLVYTDKEKTCSLCGIIKPLTEYDPRKKRNGSIGVRPACKKCDRERMARTRKTHPSYRSGLDKARLDRQNNCRYPSCACRNTQPCSGCSRKYCDEHLTGLFCNACIGRHQRSTWRSMVGFKTFQQITEDGVEIRPIPGFLGYWASSKGEVWSNRNFRGGLRSEYRRLNGSRDTDGYRTVTLSNCGNQITKRLSHVILESFKGPRPEGAEACHFPVNDKNDNQPENLMWGTHRENITHKFVHGTVARGERHGMSAAKKLERENSAVSKVTATSRRIVLSSGVCARCGSPDNLTVDHIVPRSAGGSSDISNLQPLCLGCNRRKGATVERGYPVHPSRAPYTVAPELWP